MAAAWMEFDTGLTYYYERQLRRSMQETPNETRLYGTKGGLKFHYPTWRFNEAEFFSWKMMSRAKKPSPSI